MAATLASVSSLSRPKFDFSRKLEAMITNRYYFCHSWLVKKHRDQEALLILSKINYCRRQESFVETCLELEHLRESVRVAAGNKRIAQIRELCRWKYIYR